MQDPANNPPPPPEVPPELDPPPDTAVSAKPILVSYAGWIVAVLLVVAVWAAAVALRPGPVHLDGWQPGLDAGMQAAEDADRPMVVMFTADWCGPCQQLKKDVLQSPQAEQAIAEGFVPVVVDVDAPASAQAVQRFGVRGIPLLLLTDAEGNRLPGTLAYPMDSSVPGPYPYARTPAGFTAWLDSANSAASR